MFFNLWDENPDILETQAHGRFYSLMLSLLPTFRFHDRTLLKFYRSGSFEMLDNDLRMIVQPTASRCKPTALSFEFDKDGHCSSPPKNSTFLFILICVSNFNPISITRKRRLWRRIYQCQYEDLSTLAKVFVC